MNVEINPSEYKILIVDDVISNVLLLKVLLTNEKFNIVTAGNGTQALEQVKKENGNQKVTEHLCGIYEFLEKKKMDSLQELEKK